MTAAHKESGHTHQAPIIEVRGVSRVFPGVKALDNVSLSLYPGECLALLGENGAGKSTLSKIITGVYQPSEGAMIVGGVNVTERGNYNIGMAQEMGVTIVHQELQLIPEMNGIENIFIGRFDRKLGMVDWKSMKRKAEEIMAFLGADIDLTVPVKHLRTAEKQIIQLAKAISVNAKMIIMDELTAVLQEKEIANIYRIIDILKKRGMGIIYISHRLDEIFEVCDTYAVMVDGRLIHRGKVADVNKDQLVEMIIGRELTQVFPPLNENIGEVVLEVKGLTADRAFRNIDLTLRRGEVVGIAGLVGAGKTELLNAIFGSYRKTGGEIRINGQKVNIRRPQDAIAHGIGLVPDERKQLGLVMHFNITHNTTLASMRKFRRKSLLMDHRREREATIEAAEMMKLNYVSPSQSVSKLSGGNQQKIVISKWLLADSDILIFDEPTRGIDVGAKSEIYKLINRLTREGKSVIIVSPEMEELIGLCHRIYIMFEGEFRGCVSGEDKTQNNIVSKMLGV
jgi:ABC-type sugar transport system ATPase subunit